MSHRPLEVVVDDVAALTSIPPVRALVYELLRTGRRNGVRVRIEQLLPYRQYPTLTALNNAADQT